MHGQHYLFPDETDEVKGSITEAGKLSLRIGDAVFMFTEPQAREVLETLIDLVSDARLTRTEAA